jgi:hypothetical protein
LNRSVLASLLLATLVSAAACSGSSATTADAQGNDPDGGPTGPDAGRPSLCPIEPNPMCTKANDCNMDNLKPSNCAACRPYNHAVCARANCEMPELLSATDILAERFDTGTALVPRLRSFAGFIIDAETAGGNLITCADIYGGRVSLDERCYNILDSLGRGATGAMGTTYPFTFSGFASGRKALLVIYGYEMDGELGDPIGVSCTLIDPVSPGSGITNVAGDMMQPI